MPTYEYRCPDCGHEFEQFQSMKADPIKECPECKEQNVKRLISSGGGLIFKGSGFYETDYRSSSYKRDANKASGSNGSSSKETSKSSTSK